MHPIRALASRFRPGLDCSSLDERRERHLRAVEPAARKRRRVAEVPELLLLARATTQARFFRDQDFPADGCILRVAVSGPARIQTNSARGVALPAQPRRY